jgi:hypothetical protein
MVTYEEPLEIKRGATNSSAKSSRRSQDRIWSLLKEVPLQWLEDYHTEKGFLPEFVNPKTLSPDPNTFGVAYYLDGSIASGFQIEATDPQFLSEKDANAIHVQLESAITSIQKDENLQFLWCALDEDEDSLQNYENDRKGLKTHPAQSYVRSELLKRERARLASGELKSYRAFCFVNTPGIGSMESQGEKSMLQTIMQSLKEIPQTLLSQARLVKTKDRNLEMMAIAESTRKNIEATQNVMMGFSSAPGISVKPLNATQIYRLLRRSWSPGSWEGDKLTIGKTLETLQTPLRYALPSYYLLEDVEDEWGWTWKTGDFWHRILTLRIPPEFADIGTMVAQMVARENCEIYNSEYTLTLRPTKGTQAIQALHANLKLYRKQFEGNPKEHENLRFIIDGMATQLDKLMRSDGTHVFEANLLVHIWDRDEKKLDRWEAGLMRTFSMGPQKARFAPEQFNALPYYLGYGTPGFTRCEDRHRCFTYLADEAVTHIPLLGESDGFIQEEIKGRRAPTLLETHRGTLYVQDDFARGRVIAYNGIAVGTSGSGKSMFYNLKIARSYSPKDIIIVIDGAIANGSYRSLAHILAGKDSYVETGLDLGDKTHAKNPLFTERLADGSYREPTTEEVSRMVNTIEPMVRLRPGQSLTQTDRGQITASIHLAFENFREDGGKVFLRGVAKAMREKGKASNDTSAIRAREMAQHLEEQWCYPKGTYWQFVDRESTPSPKNLIVYDLKGISQDETLKGVMVATYLNHIHSLVNENLKKSDEERARIWIIIDEGWAALMDPIMVQSLLGLFRAGRGRNVSVHCLTQQMMDFKKILIASDSSTGATAFDPNNNSILGNTTWFNLFKHDPEDIKITQEILRLAPNQADEIMNLGASKGYREMIQYARLLNGNAFNKLYVRPLPWELAAYTSDVKEQGQAFNIRQAILKEWERPENHARARARIIAELEEAGFQNAEEELNDEQAIEILTALRKSRNS